MSSSDHLEHLKDELSAATLEALREHLDGPRSAQLGDASVARPQGNQVYSKMEYWDARFEDEEQYEWLLGW
eukprot:scaffold357_cov239-Pinguiococcus_pyrenoidosus.AAC.8